MEDEEILELVKRSVCLLAAAAAWSGLSTMSGNRSHNVIKTAKEMKYWLDEVTDQGEETIA